MERSVKAEGYEAGLADGRAEPIELEVMFNWAPQKMFARKSLKVGETMSIGLRDEIPMLTIERTR